MRTPAEGAVRHRTIMVRLAVMSSLDFLEAKVREIVAEQLGLAEEDVQPEAAFSADLGADALDFMEIVMALEEEFEVEIGDAEAEDLRTVRDAVDFLARRS